jgi:hypothetical protein
LAINAPTNNRGQPNPHPHTNHRTPKRGNAFLALTFAFGSVYDLEAIQDPKKEMIKTMPTNPAAPQPSSTCPDFDRLDMDTDQEFSLIHDQLTFELDQEAKDDLDAHIDQSAMRRGE